MHKQGLEFGYFYYSVNLLLYFSIVLYLHLLDWWYVYMWTSYDQLSNPTYLPVYMKVNYLFNNVY